MRKLPDPQPSGNRNTSSGSQVCHLLLPKGEGIGTPGHGEALPYPLLSEGEGRRSRRGEVSSCGAILGLLLLAGAAHAAVTPADAPAIKRAIAAQKGHVVLVNFWATWCGPCVAEFPAIVKASRKYRAQGLSVIAVSADSAKDLHTKVEPFLAKQGATFPAYLEKSADPEDFINALDPTWQGDLPRTFIYDRQGRRVKTLTGEQTAQSLAAAITPYLKRPARTR